MNEKAKPFIKWVGGKTQLLNDIDNALPKNILCKDDVTYIEPFVGGGAVLFWILQKYQNIKKAVINDINKDLINVYKTVKSSPKVLIDLLQNIESYYLPLNDEARKEYFLEIRDKFNSKEYNIIENSAFFIFLNRTCFNVLYRVNKKGMFNVPFGSYKKPTICDKKTILADSKLLQCVDILNEDFEVTMNYADKNCFFYLDPPYKPLSKTSSFNSYSKEVFDDNEQVRLSTFCKRLDEKGYSFILSNSDVRSKNPNDNFFDDLYEPFFIKRVHATRMVNANSEKRGKLTELLISNKDSNAYKDIMLRECSSIKRINYD